MNDPLGTQTDGEREAMRWHELKTDPAVFDAVADGSKTHEIRRNDRDFRVGDGLLLRRTKFTGAQMHMRPGACPLEYTGEEYRAVVTHVLEGYGLSDHWVILSIRPYRASVATQPPAEQQLDNETFRKGIRPDGTVEGYPVETHYLPSDSIGDDTGFLRVRIDAEGYDIETRVPHCALIALGWVKAATPPVAAKPQPVTGPCQSPLCEFPTCRCVK